MHPELIDGVRSYAAFLAIADVVGFGVAIYAGRRLGIGTGRLLACLVLLTFVAFGGAKLFSVAQRGWETGSLAAEMASGYRFPGAVAALAVVIAAGGWVLPVPPLRLADAIAPAFPFSMAISRVGCFLTGCCGGKLCDLPWAVQFPAPSQVWGAQRRAGLVAADSMSSLHVHPLQIYFGLFSLAVGIFILWFFPRRRYDGQVFLAFVAVQGIGKFLLESFRFVAMPEIRYGSLILGLLSVCVLVGVAANERRAVRIGAPSTVSRESW